MKNPSRVGVHRVQIDFDKSLYARLKRMRKDLKFTTDTGVIRGALGFYGFISAFRKQGWKPVMVRESDGHSIELNDDNLKLFQVSSQPTQDK
jgi:hypothetical protein